MSSILENRIVDIIFAIGLKLKRGANVRIFGSDYWLDDVYVLASTSIPKGTARVERLIHEEPQVNSPIGFVSGYLGNELNDLEVLIVPAGDVLELPDEDI